MAMKTRTANVLTSTSASPSHVLKTLTASTSQVSLSASAARDSLATVTTAPMSTSVPTVRPSAAIMHHAQILSVHTSVPVMMVTLVMERAVTTSTSVSATHAPPMPTVTTTTVATNVPARAVSKWSAISVKILTSVLLVIMSVTLTPTVTTPTVHTDVHARTVSLEMVAAVLNFTLLMPITKCSMLTET